VKQTDDGMEVSLETNITHYVRHLTAPKPATEGAGVINAGWLLPPVAAAGDKLRTLHSTV